MVCITVYKEFLQASFIAPISVKILLPVRDEVNCKEETHTHLLINEELFKGRFKY
jgi:hypothetical protein